MRTARVKQEEEEETRTLLLLYKRLKGLKSLRRGAKDRNTRGTSSKDCREQGSHTRGVYPTQHNSSMETAIVKQEEETDTRIIAKE